MKANRHPQEPTVVYLYSPVKQINSSHSHSDSDFMMPDDDENKTALRVADSAYSFGMHNSSMVSTAAQHVRKASAPPIDHEVCDLSISTDKQPLSQYSQRKVLQQQITSNHKLEDELRGRIAQLQQRKTHQLAIVDHFQKQVSTQAQALSQRQSKHKRRKSQT